VRPFFNYYGGKWRLAPRYPKPIHDTIIEPFAGSAGYSTRHPQKKVILYDLNPKIFGVWDYLIKASPVDVLRLPLVERIEDANVCQEAQWLIGFWLGRGSSSPRKSISAWGRDGKWTHLFWGKEIRQRIANQMNNIRHWQVHNKSYADCPNQEATWFIDPPYNSKAGDAYPNRDVDYPHLSEWSMQREGQSMVCEMWGADWMPFKSFAIGKSTSGTSRSSHCHEVIWINSWSTNPHTHQPTP